MGDQPIDGTQYRWTPDEWFVVFWRKTNIRLARYIACGEFKHVTACGYVEKADAWLFVDPRWNGTVIETIPNHMVDLRLAEWARDNLILQVRSLSLGSFPRFGFWCVPVVAHLIGSKSCAFRPDGLLRSLRPRASAVIDWRKPYEDEGRCPEAGGRALPAGAG